MHILSRIESSQDPWEKVALLSLQQLTEDMSINQKRIRALEKSVMALAEALARSETVKRRDVDPVGATLQALHEEIRSWSTQSLDREEDLVLAIQQLIFSQRRDSAPEAPRRLAS